MPETRDPEWTSLGLPPEDQDLLQRHRPDASMDPSRALALSERLLDRLPGEGGRDRWAGLRLVLHHLRMRPLGVLGSTAAPILLGIAATVATANHFEVSPLLPAALWAAVAPWMAILLITGPSPARSDALGTMERAAPVSPTEVLLWRLLVGGVLDLLLVLGVAIWSGGLLRVVWPLLLLQWVIPFTASAGVALIIAALLRPSRATVLLWLLGVLNTFAWIAGFLGAHWGPASIWVLHAQGLPVSLLLSGLLLGLGILLQRRRAAVQ